MKLCVRSFACLTILACAGSTYAASFGDELRVFTAEDPTFEDGFGGAVDLDGNTVVVGVFRDDDRGEDSGSAYVFDLSSGEQLFKFAPDDLTFEDRFGSSVAIGPNTIAVGAFTADRVPGLTPGATFLFDATTGLQITKISIEGSTNFGISVDLLNDNLIVGAFNDDVRGAAYLFDLSSGEKPVRLAPESDSRASKFGSAVALSGDFAIIGVQQDSERSFQEGSAYVFNTISGEQLFILRADDTNDSDRFGRDVDIDGNIAIIGAPLHDTPDGELSGTAYLFDVTTGEQLFKLTPNDGRQGGFFGTAVAIHGNYALVGASHKDSEFPASGAAYLFDIRTGEEIIKLVSSEPGPVDFFGISVAMNDQYALIGASCGDIAGECTGSVHLFQIPEPSSFVLAGMALFAMLLAYYPLRGRQTAPVALRN